MSKSIKIYTWVLVLIFIIPFVLSIYNFFHHTAAVSEQGALQNEYMGNIKGIDFSQMPKMIFVDPNKSIITQQLDGINQVVIGQEKGATTTSSIEISPDAKYMVTLDKSTLVVTRIADSAQWNISIPNSLLGSKPQWSPNGGYIYWQVGPGTAVTQPLDATQVMELQKERSITPIKVVIVYGGKINFGNVVTPPCSVDVWSEDDTKLFCGGVVGSEDFSIIDVPKLVSGDKSAITSGQGQFTESGYSCDSMAINNTGEKIYCAEPISDGESNIHMFAIASSSDGSLNLANSQLVNKLPIEFRSPTQLMLTPDQKYLMVNDFSIEYFGTLGLFDLSNSKYYKISVEGAYEKYPNGIRWYVGK